MSPETAATRGRNVLAEAIDAISGQGYVHLTGLYPAQDMDRARTLVSDWYERSRQRQLEIADVSGSPALANSAFVWNLQNKDTYFLRLLFASPLVESILKHFLNDPWYKRIPPEQPNYILRSFLARSSTGALALHIDSMLPQPGPQTTAMQFAIALEDQTEEAGCTLLVPGSHRSGAYADPLALDQAVAVPSRKGDVLLWDSRIWHGAGANRGDGSRWLMIATFCRWWIKQMFAITETLPPEIYESLSDPQRAVLGFCSRPWRDETEGVDMRNGYDVLPSRPGGDGGPA